MSNNRPSPRFSIQSADAFKALFEGKDEVLERKEQESKHRRKSLGSLGGLGKFVFKKIPVIKDNRFAINLEEELTSREVTNISAKDFLGHWTEDREGNLKMDIIIRPPSPSWAWVIYSLFTNSEYEILLRVTCKREERSYFANISCYSAKLYSKIGCLMAFLIGLVTFFVGGILAYFSLKKARRYEDKVVDAFADALRETIGVK